MHCQLGNGSDGCGKISYFVSSVGKWPKVIYHLSLVAVGVNIFCLLAEDIHLIKCYSTCHKNIEIVDLTIVIVCFGYCIFFVCGWYIKDIELSQTTTAVTLSVNNTGQQKIDFFSLTE